jgi:TPR repeat protein
VKRFALTIGLVAVIAGGITPAHAGFDEWLKGVMNHPGRHALKGYRDPRPPKVIDPMKAIRNKMVQGEAVSFKQLRQLANSGDDLAAYNLAKRIEEGGDASELPTAVAYYMRAVKGGRDFALRPIIRLLEAGVGADDPDLLGDAEKLLAGKALKDTFARDALIRMYRAGQPFGLQPEKADELLIASAEAGDSKAALDLAFALLSGVPGPAETEQAKGYLKIAATSETLNIRTMAENILRTLEPQLTASTETVQ